MRLRHNEHDFSSSEMKHGFECGMIHTERPHVYRATWRMCRFSSRDWSIVQIQMRCCGAQCLWLSPMRCVPRLAAENECTGLWTPKGVWQYLRALSARLRHRRTVRMSSWLRMAEGCTAPYRQTKLMILVYRHDSTEIL